MQSDQERLDLWLWGPHLWPEARKSYHGCFRLCRGALLRFWQCLLQRRRQLVLGPACYHFTVVVSDGWQSNTHLLYPCPVSAPYVALGPYCSLSSHSFLALPERNLHFFFIFLCVTQQPDMQVNCWTPWSWVLEMRHPLQSPWTLTLIYGKLG